MQKVDKPYIVYMHISPSNKVYVGITSQTLLNRSHLDGSGYCANTHFWRAIQKYGWDNFEHTTLLTNVSQDWAQQIERCLIMQHNSTEPERGYNISPGGDLGCHCSEEVKQKISEKNSGKTHSQETRDKISKTLKGRPHTPQHNKKVSESLKGKYVGEMSSAYGLKRSDETRKKMSEAAKLGWLKRKAKLDADKRTDI